MIRLVVCVAGLGLYYPYFSCRERVIETRVNKDMTTVEYITTGVGWGEWEILITTAYE